MTRFRWGIATALAVCALALPGSSALAQDAKKAADANVYNTLREVINQGADLYNGGDWNGCYRLYEGALIGIHKFLDHRPELQKAIVDGIAKAKANSDLSRRPFDLRAVIDKVRADTNPNPTPVKPADKPADKPKDKPADKPADKPVPPKTTTLWDRLGGEPNVKKVVADFVGAASTDPKVDFFRGGKFKLDEVGVAKLQKLLVEQISQVSGGPYKYTGRSMKEAHKGMGITNAQFDALAGHLQKALEKNGAKPDDVKAVMGVIGGTRADIVEPSKPEPPKDKDKPADKPTDKPADKPKDKVEPPKDKPADKPTDKPAPPKDKPEPPKDKVEPLKDKPTKDKP